MLIAQLDGQEVDAGTAAEVGYAAALGLPCLGVRSDLRASGEPGMHVNLQLEAFIVLSGGFIAGSLDELVRGSRAARRRARASIPPGGAVSQGLRVGLRSDAQTSSDIGGAPRGRLAGREQRVLGADVHAGLGRMKGSSLSLSPGSVDAAVERMAVLAVASATRGRSGGSWRRVRVWHCRRPRRRVSAPVVEDGVVVHRAVEAPLRRRHCRSSARRHSAAGAVASR